jgi:hypothetical protein
VIQGRSDSWIDFVYISGLGYASTALALFGYIVAATALAARAVLDILASITAAAAPAWIRSNVKSKRCGLALAAVA